MKVRFFAAVAAALAVFTASADVQAAYITSNGTVAVAADPINESPGGNPPIERITTMFTQGAQLFTNQVNGAPFQVGSTVRTVGVAQLWNVTGPDGQNFLVEYPDVNGQPVNLIFAVEGTITGISGTGNPEATFTEGALWLTTRQPGFQAADPTTWNFGGSFTRYDLAPPADVIPGATQGIEGGNFIQSAGNVNVSQALVSQNRGDGTFVFGSTAFGENFVTDVDMPGGGTTDQDFLVASTTQLVQPVVIPLNVAQQTALNTIGAAAGFGGAWNQGGYTPTNRGIGSGDFNAGLEATLFVAAVPEPSSLAIFGLLCGGAAVRFTKRRFAKKA